MTDWNKLIFGVNTANQVTLTITLGPKKASADLLAISRDGSEQTKSYDEATRSWVITLPAGDHVLTLTLAERLGERLLHRLLGDGAVREDRVADAEHRAAIPLREQPERAIEVAGAQAFTDIVVVHDAMLFGTVAARRGRGRRFVSVRSRRVLRTAAITPAKTVRSTPSEQRARSRWTDQRVTVVG